MKRRCHRLAAGLARRVSGWLAAVLLACAGWVVRLPLHPPTLIPYITWIPFIALSGCIGGLGPGLLTTLLSTLAAIYFATEPFYSFQVGDPQHWIGIAALVVSGVVITVLFDWLKKTQRALRAANTELTAIHNHTPVELLLVDEKLRVRQWRQGAATGESGLGESTELGPGSVLRCANALAHPKGCGFGPNCGECTLRQVVLDTIRNGKRHDDIEVCLASTEGSSSPTRCLLVSSVPIRLGGQQALVWAQDITKRKLAEAGLRESQARLEAALAESHAGRSLLEAVFAAQTEGVLVSDATGTVIRTNPAAAGYFGFEPSGMHISAVVEKLRIPGGPEASFTQRALLGETTIDGEQDAGDRVLQTSSAPMRNAEGRIIGAVTVSRDITGRRRMEEALRITVRELEQALAEKTVLLREVHHRVKNNLAVISSLLSMKADLTDRPEARAALDESQKRVRSIELIHEQLYGNDRLDRIDFVEYTQQLLQELRAALIAEPGRIAFRAQLQPVDLGLDRAVPCALILNELVSNAVKHAFPDGRRGEVRIGMRETDQGLLELTIEDDGVGCPAAFPPKNGKSLGMRIVRILTRQLDGTLTQEAAQGTRFTLRFPSGTAMTR